MPLPKCPRPEDDDEEEVMEATSNVGATANSDLNDTGYNNSR